MATYTVARSKKATLSGTVADSVQITGGFELVEVKNFDTAQNLTVVHGQGSAPTAPTADVDDCDIVLGPLETAVINVEPGQGNTYVGLVGSANAYQVRGIRE